MAVKAKKKVTSKKTVSAPKQKAEARKTPKNGVEKAIIAMSENIDRLSGNVDRLSGNVDRLSENIEHIGRRIDKAVLSMDKSLSVMTASMAASKKETDAKIAEANASMAASKKETDAKIAEANASMTASLDRLDRVVESTKAELAGLSESSGRAVESMTYSFFDARMTFAGIKFDDMEVGVNRKRKLPDGKRIYGEYDVVLYNGSAIALIEAKSRVRMEDLDKLINVQMPRFKLFFPQYKDFKYYLGLCGMSFEDGVEEVALDMGVGTLKLSGDAVEINETAVKAW